MTVSVERMVRVSQQCICRIGGFLVPAIYRCSRPRLLCMVLERETARES